MSAQASDKPADETLQQPVARISRRRRRWVVGICAAVVAVYLAALSSHWWVGKDGAMYLCLARNLARGRGYTLAGEAHTLAAPGYPAMLAGLMLVGADSFLAMNAVTALMGLTAALAAYLLLRRLVDRDWALLLAGAFALSNELLQRSGETLTDVPFTLLVIAALWLYARGLGRRDADRGGWEVASLLLVASCWIRMAGFPLAAGAAGGLVLSAWRTARRRALVNLLIVAIGCAATVAAFYAYATFHAASGGSSYVGGLQDYVQSLPLWRRLLMPAWRLYEAASDFSRLLIAQEMPGWVCLPLLVAPVVAAMIRRIRGGDWVGPMAVTFYIGGMCAAMIQVRTRYFLPVAPLLMLYFVEGWAWLAGRLAKARRPEPAKVAVALLVVMVGFNAPKVARNIIVKRRGDYMAAQQGGKWRDLMPTVEFLRANRPAAGSMLGDYAYGYLADIPRPSLPRRLRESSPSREQAEKLIRTWDLRFLVIKTSDRPRPLVAALRDYLRTFGPPAFRHGEVVVYAVGPHRPRRAGGAPTPKAGP